MRRPVSAAAPISAPSSSPKGDSMDFSKPSKFSPRVSSHSSLSFPFLPHPTQLPPLLSNPKPCGSSGGRFGCFCIAFLLVLCFSFYSFSFSRGFRFSTQFQSVKNSAYVIIIDAGSFGSRLHVFQYLNEGPIPRVNLLGREGWSLKTKPGLSAYVEEPGNAGHSLAELLKFAAGKVPKDERGVTRIYLMATAGLRRLDLHIQNAVLESCRVALRVSGFNFRDNWASVITGPCSQIESGKFHWIGL